MGIIKLETLIHAPAERCFDLSRSVELHLHSAKQTGERAIGGVTTGLMKLNDTVTWQAKHFGITQTLTVKIVAFDRPRSFTDSQVKGIFHSFDHVHEFFESGGQTIMRDLFTFKCPLGPLGMLVDSVIQSHLRSFLIIRNQTIKEIAEGDGWRSILK